LNSLLKFPKLLPF